MLRVPFANHKDTGLLARAFLARNLACTPHSQELKERTTNPYEEQVVLELGKDFAKYFLTEYTEHRWPRLRRSVDSYGPSIWTEQMFKILDKVAGRMKLEWKEEEMLRIDRAYYRADEECPTIAVEHENGYKGIWESEIHRLLVVNANLRVLICYPPKKEHFMLQKRVQGKLNAEMRDGHFNKEFLLILGKENEVYPRDKNSFNIYWYSPGIYTRKLTR